MFTDKIDIFCMYFMILLNFKCQNYNVSGKHGAPKTKLLSANASVQLKTKKNPKFLVLFYFQTTKVVDFKQNF